MELGIYTFAETTPDPRTGRTISPQERLRDLLEEIARKHPRVMRDPAPTSRVKSLGDFGVNLELTTWLANLAEGESEVRSALFKQLLKAFRDEGIAIAYRRREAAPIPTSATEESDD